MNSHHTHTHTHNSTTTTFKQTFQQPKHPTSTCLTPCARDSASRPPRSVRHLTLTAPLVEYTDSLAVQPDSTKSNTEKASESLSGAGDRIAGAVQPGMHLTPQVPFIQTCTLTITIEGQKSAGQKLGDATRSGHDDASNKSGGVMQQAQESLSNAGQTISDSLSGGQKK